MMISIRILLLLIVAFKSQIARADLSYTPAVKRGNGTVVVPKIKMFGEIRDTDAAQFPSLLSSAKESARTVGLESLDRTPVLIELDSRGGSVRAALTIGKQIRAANPFGVNVQNGATCVSACVLVLAGGTYRFVRGTVGIHRPYLNDDRAFTPDQQKRNYATIEKDVKDYLMGVNIPTSLYDMMFRIPPESVRYLDDRELQLLGLNEDDPYFREAENAHLSKKSGMSKNEYLRQQKICSQSKTHIETMECYNRLDAITKQ